MCPLGWDRFAAGGRNESESPVGIVRIRIQGDKMMESNLMSDLSVSDDEEAAQSNPSSTEEFPEDRASVQHVQHTHGEPSAEQMLKAQVTLFNKYLPFEDLRSRAFLMTYPVYTRVFSIFDYAPPILFNDEDQLITDRVGLYLEKTCYRALAIALLNTPPLPRVIAAQQGTLIFYLSAATDWPYLQKLLLGGSRRNGQAVELVASEDEPVDGIPPEDRIGTRSLFCPKITFINTPRIRIELLRFSILFELTDPSRNHRFLHSEFIKECETIANLADEFCKNQAPFIEANKNFKGIEGFSNLDQNLWVPLLVPAKVVDDSLPHPFLYKRILALAKEQVDLKRRLLLQSEESKILEGVYTFINENKPYKDTGAYMGEDLRDFIKVRWNIDNLQTKRVSEVLNSKGLIIGHKRPRKDFIEKDGIKEVQRAAYVLDKPRLHEITQKHPNRGEQYGL